MAQVAKQSNQFDYQVESVPSFMQLPDGNFARDGFILTRRTDNLAVLGKASDRYGVIQNADLVSAAEDAFKSKSMTDYKRTMIVTGQGEKMYAVYDFKNHVKKLRKGDEVGLRLTAQNSFDGSLRASFSLGMLRLVCTNGMTTMEREVSMTKKHSSGINVRFITDALERAMKAWSNSTELFDRLADVSISQEQGLAILANLEDLNVLSGKLREGAQGIWAAPTYREDSERNLFNLYNATTQYLSHEVSTDRFELANRASSNVLATLAKAAQDTRKFDKLIMMPASMTTAMLN